MKNNRVFPSLLNKIFNEPGANSWIDGFEKVCDLGSGEFNIFRLEDLRKDKDEIWVISGPNQRHLKTNVLVLLENPSGVFEDLVHILLP